MPNPEIEALLADQSFVPPTIDKDDSHFIEKLDALKIYMISKQMAFEDLIQLFHSFNFAKIPGLEIRPARPPAQFALGELQILNQ
ncbi:MAG: hypothetical protein EZS28_004166 [Streblomastix strix]|uniref:Uncharacterized protein n=1 Tax=Streblomastix strix TaxID=222440 RepID=A0A5J4WYX7_9EUKA|nr:MAG: hypothetical protein EZS28_004166 [Streblomastix strix]